ncbi:hypothetical protein CS542_01900 [Pedobacter sp. IW39]|nr:hypothetical protein CS542_01900 [Pedobacter sp. IW39]
MANEGINPLLKMLLFLRTGFKHIAEERNITANNAAKSVNLLHAIKGEFPNQEINWDAGQTEHC